ncbi:MAG: hypothetical protein NVSMB21_07980 [Vulcanimicrobiaceae bacterium]
MPSAHALARELAERVAASVGLGEMRSVLHIGLGSGRNVPPFLGARLRVAAVEGDEARATAAARRFAHQPRVRIAARLEDLCDADDASYAGALSTHALLHGTLAEIGAAIDAVRARLAPDAPFYATLGSTNDPRYGVGRRLAAATFAPLAGDETGIAHSYVDLAGARSLFARFVIESLEENHGGASVGRWAHGEAEAARIVHWYVRARREGPAIAQ